MRLDDIDLYLHILEYPSELGSEFNFRARHICNFLRRKIKPLRFQTEGFNRIVVRGCHSVDDTCPIGMEKAVVPSVIFDRERYDALTPEERPEFFIGMLHEGIEKCARHHNIPIAAIMEAIEEFRRGGYRNEWIHQSKLLRPHGIRASLLCKMDSERFVLTLVLERKDKILFKESILETKPDETCFYYLFKDITIKDDTIIITNRFSALQEPLLRLDIRPLLAGR